MTTSGAKRAPWSTLIGDESQTAGWFFEHAADLFAVVAPTGQLTECNPAWTAVTGRPRDQLIGTRFLDLVHPDSRPDLVRQVRALDSIAHAPISLRVARHDGGWAQLRGEVRRGPDGQVMGALRDVTEEFKAAETVANAQKVQRYLSEAAGVGLWWFDPRSQRITWSDEWLAMLAKAGVSMTTEEDFGRYCHPDDLPGVLAAMDGAIDHGRPGAFEHRLRTDAGGWMHVRGHVWGERLEGGLHLAHGISQDVTALVVARDMAVQGERRSRDLIEQAPYAVAIFDRALRYSMVSPRWAQLFHLEGRPHLGYDLSGLNHAPYAEVIKAQKRALAGEIVSKSEDVITDTQGHTYALRWECRPWRDGAGNVDGVVMYADDISAIVAARREAEDRAGELAVALQLAQAATEAKSRFLANISHEIRTPMNGVLGVLHLLKAQNLCTPGEGLIDEALACGGMLQALLDDVIDFSRIEAGHLELNPDPLSPAAVAEGVVKLLSPQADRKGLALSVEAEDGLGEVMADPARLRQCLFNLVGNAVKFTEAGHVTVRAGWRGTGAQKRLRFEVEDSGIGIPEAAQARVFERFQQADGSTTRRFGGSGLGLAITRRLAQIMGGEVGLTSTPGVGSTFWLEIAAPPAQRPSADHAVTPSGLADLDILLIEDNATNRLIASRILEGLGARVTCAEDGERGVEAARLRPFDLILMDIQMPGIDGLEATRQIRALPSTAAGAPIIALTANVMSHQRDSYRAAGIDGVVAKPISPGALLAEIARVAEAA
ncbi:ATP-binding protein [Caulobacter sp. KR2-114]|uniref:ATP-binding protein n=1 Tax=Caulobacter sp. KR2-114 TaxID=3400912 RepID=UPI003C044F8B